MNIFVRTRADEPKLRELFSVYGTVTTINVINGKGFAFVTMLDDAEAQKAIDALDGKIVNGEQWTVNQARERGAASNDRNQQRVGGRPNHRGQNTQPAGNNQTQGQFVNPYNFVPVKTVKDTPETLRLFHEENSHWQDRFREGTHSGRVVCELETESEIFIGAGKKGDSKPAELEPFELNGKAAIPPSSIKGMLSSIMEAGSNSALRVLENKENIYYSRRVEARPPDPLSKIGILHKSGNIFGIEPLNGEFIYLNAYRYDDETEKFVLTGTLKNILLQDYSVSPVFYYAKKNEIQPSRNRYSHKSLKPIKGSLLDEESYKKLSEGDKGGYFKGIIKHFGVSGRDDTIPRGKKHEFFIEYNPSNLISLLPVPEETIEDFNALAKDAFERDANLPFTPFGRHKSTSDPVKLREGDVLYYRTKQTCSGMVVGKLSFSAIWRDFCGDDKTNNNAYGYFRTIDASGFLLPPSLENQKKSKPEEFNLTAASALMGFVEEQKQKNKAAAFALAGRLFFSPGTLSPEHDSKQVRNGEKTLKILDGPKPPCPEFYFHEKTVPGHFITKKELKPDGCFLPNGRKFYWHHHNEKDPYAPSGTYKKDHPDQQSKIKPIKKNTKFLFTIDFFNLTDFELGMLIYAIRPTLEFRHLIGMGKPIGLGCVKIDILNLLFVNRQERYEKDALFYGHFFHTQIGTNEKRLESISKEWAEDDSRQMFEKQRFCGEAQDKKESEHNAEHYINIFKKKIEDLYGPNWLTPLENIGNPAATEGLDVRYPPDPENSKGYDEAFKWWVRNSNKERHIDGAQRVLPPIPSAIGQQASILPVNPKA